MKHYLAGCLKSCCICHPPRDMPGFFLVLLLQLSPECRYEMVIYCSMKTYISVVQPNLKGEHRKPGSGRADVYW